jgi:hypothetical protein
MSQSDGLRRESFQLSISAINQGLYELDTLANNGDELPSFMNILSRAKAISNTSSM